MVAKRKSAKKAAPKTVAKKVAAPKAAAAKTTKRKTSRKAAKKTAVAKAPVQRVGGWWFGSFSGSGLLIAVSALLAVCAFFFGWIHIGMDGGFNWTFNGLDFLTADAKIRTNIFQDSWQLMIPLFEFILAILAFIAIIIPAFGVRGGRIGIDAFVIIVGIVMFILAICFLFGNVADLGFAGNNKFINNLDVGFYVTIVASVIMILGGLRDATKNY